MLVLVLWAEPVVATLEVAATEAAKEETETAAREVAEQDREESEVAAEELGVRARVAPTVAVKAESRSGVHSLSSPIQRHIERECHTGRAASLAHRPGTRCCLPSRRRTCLRTTLAVAARAA